MRQTHTLRETHQKTHNTEAGRGPLTHNYISGYYSRQKIVKKYWSLMTD